MQIAPALAIATALLVQSSVAFGLPQELENGWRLESKYDDLEDRAMHSVSKYAAATRSGLRQESKDDSKSLTLSYACEKRASYPALHYQSEKFASHRAVLVYRFDQVPHREAQSIYSAQRDRVLLLDNPAEAASFLTSMSQHRQLRVRVTDPIYGQIEGDFDLTGAAEALAKVRKLCAT